MKEYQNLTFSQETILKHYLPDEENIKKLANLYYAFSDSTRLKIIMCLSMMSMCVGDISTLLGINQSTISHQLQLLRTFGIVTAKRDKKNMTYSICNEYVEKMIECGVDASN